MGDGPLFSFLILSSYFLLPTSYFLLSSFFFLLSSLRLRAFAPLRFFLPAFFSSSQPRQEQQPEPGTFGV